MAKPEKVAERRFTAKMKKNGWPCFKITTFGSFGEAGYPDRLCLGPYSLVVWFEFKRIGEDAKKLQKYRHRVLKKLGHKVHVVYKADEAFKIFTAHVRAQALSRSRNRIRN